MLLTKQRSNGARARHALVKELVMSVIPFTWIKVRALVSLYPRALLNSFDVCA